MSHHVSGKSQETGPPLKVPIFFSCCPLGIINEPSTFLSLGLAAREADFAWDVRIGKMSPFSWLGRQRSPGLGVLSHLPVPASLLGL